MIDLPAIQTHRLSRWYGRTEAVRELDLSVACNRITGFLGRNGAGKSSTIKMLLGMIRPTSGQGRVLAGLSQNGGVFLTQRAACLVVGHFRY
jgi:ABC-2 type transport system ATP-binding protein